MTKLLKYEFLRRKQMLIGAAIAMLFIEGVVLVGIYNGGGWKEAGVSGWNNSNILAVAMTALLVIGGYACVPRLGHKALFRLQAEARLYDTDDSAERLPHNLG